MATRLLDTDSLLACSMYVNLDPTRAGLAESPETSRYTSAFERIQALQAWPRDASSYCDQASWGTQCEAATDVPSRQWKACPRLRTAQVEWPGSSGTGS